MALGVAEFVRHYHVGDLAVFANGVKGRAGDDYFEVAA